MHGGKERSNWEAVAVAQKEVMELHMTAMVVEGESSSSNLDTF